MKTVLLEEVCEKIVDGTHKTPKYTQTGIRFLSIKNIKPFKPVDWNAYVKYISPEEHALLIKRAKPERNDILFPRIGTMGYAKRIDFNEEISIFVGLGLLKLKKQIVDPRYVEYWMNTKFISDLSREKATGSGRLTLALRETAKLPIPLYNLNEQRMIVKKLDDAFYVIDRAKENTEKNLKNSSEIFHSKLATLLARTAKDAPTMSLKDVCTELFAGGDVPKNNHSKNISDKYTVPILSNGEKNKGLYGYTDKPRVVKPSITISARGTIGYVQLRDQPFLPVVRLIVLTPDTNIVAPDYLYYALTSINFANTGTSIPQLTVPMVKDREIPVPSIARQNQLAKELERASRLSQKLQELYRKKLEVLGELRKSILKKAFNGEL